MSTYDDQVNDYLRAVEQALDDVPASRRDALLADLSDHIAAKLADSRRGDEPHAPARSSATEVRSVLDLLGDPQELAAQLRDDDVHDAGTPIEINPGRKVGALIWVLITIATVSLLCVGVVLGGVFLVLTHRS